MRLAMKYTLGFTLLLPLTALAFDVPPGFTSLEFGLFSSTQGETQDIDIQGLVGNQYTVVTAQALCK